MKTKAEILKSKKEEFFYVDDHVVDGSVDAVYEAMDEYAKSLCINFNHWQTSEECNYSCTDENQWTHNETRENITNEELFNVFIKEQDDAGSDTTKSE